MRARIELVVEHEDGTYLRASTCWHSLENPHNVDDDTIARECESILNCGGETALLVLERWLQNGEHVSKKDGCCGGETGCCGV